MITESQHTLIKQYRDKCYITCILCQESSSYNNLMKTIINIPLILTSSAMTVINSSFNADDIKIANIILNASTSLILSLLGNFKFTEKSSHFRSMNIKFTKLLHQIEDLLINDFDEVEKDDIKKIIADYDMLVEGLEYDFNNFIKERVKLKYKDTKTLPNILNCSSDILYNNNTTTTTSTDIVIVNNNETVVK